MRPPLRPWRFIVAMVRFQPWLFLASALTASVLFYLVPLLPGLVVRAFFDGLTDASAARFSTWTLLALFVGIGAGRVAGLITANICETTFNQYVESLLRKNMLGRILQRPGARAVPISPGEAISRFRDDTGVAGSFLSWTLDPIGQSLVLVLGIGFLISIDARLTIGVFLPLAAVIAIARIAGKRVERYSRANQESIGSVTGFLGEMFGAITAIKVAGAEERVVEKFREFNDVRRTATLNHLVFQELLNSISNNMANIGTGIILILSAQSIRSGDLSVGDLALFVSYLGWLATVVSMFGFYLNQYRSAGVSLDRMSALMPGDPPDMLGRSGPVYLRGSLPELPPLAALDEPLRTLEAIGLTAHYPDTRRGITEVDLRIERGTMTVIVGEVGSGKTTLLRALLGLIPHQGGAVRWNDHEVGDPGGFFVPPHTAYTPQTPRLFSETLRANILLGLPEEDADLSAALHAAVMERDIEHLEDGLETMVGARGVKLSGGQVQRAATARMFVRPAELYVFDDLSSALDVQTERILWERLFARGDVTSLVVSHRRAALGRADRIVMLADGRVAATGTLDHLLATSSIMRRLWHGQTTNDDDIVRDAQDRNRVP